MSQYLRVVAKKAALAAVLLSGMIAAAQDELVPDAELDLQLTAPIRTWDEALPLGNGLMAGLLWGEDTTLRLSLDRGPSPSDGAGE